MCLDRGSLTFSWEGRPQTSIPKGGIHSPYHLPPQNPFLARYRPCYRALYWGGGAFTIVYIHMDLHTKGYMCTCEYNPCLVSNSMFQRLQNPLTATLRARPPWGYKPGTVSSPVHMYHYSYVVWAIESATWRKVHSHTSVLVFGGLYSCTSTRMIQSTNLKTALWGEYWHIYEISYSFNIETEITENLVSCGCQYTLLHALACLLSAWYLVFKVVSVGESQPTMVLVRMQYV